MSGPYLAFTYSGVSLPEGYSEHPMPEGSCSQGEAEATGNWLLLMAESMRCRMILFDLCFVRSVASHASYETSEP